jgi:hypothetical protein
MYDNYLGIARIAYYKTIIQTNKRDSEEVTLECKLDSQGLQHIKSWKKHQGRDFVLVTILRYIKGETGMVSTHVKKWHIFRKKHDKTWLWNSGYHIRRLFFLCQSKGDFILQKDLMGMRLLSCGGYDT